MQRDVAAMVPQEEVEVVVEGDNSCVALKIEDVTMVMVNDTPPKQTHQSVGASWSES